VRSGVDRVVELAGVCLDEVQHALVDQADVEAHADGLRERIHALALHFLVDEAGQQARGQLRVLGLLDDEGGGGADRQLVELARGGAVVQAGDGLQGDAHGVDLVQAVAAAAHGAHDLVDVDGLALAAALGHGHHGASGLRRRQAEIILGGARGGGLGRGGF